MGYLNFLCSIVMAATIALAGQNAIEMPEIVPPDPQKAEQYIEDIERLTEYLEAKHADLYERVTEKEYALLAQTIKNRAETLDDGTFSVAVSQLLGLIEDGHTAVIINDYLQYYPIVIESFDDPMYDIDYLSKDYFAKEDPAYNKVLELISEGN